MQKLVYRSPRVRVYELPYTGLYIHPWSASMPTDLYADQFAVNPIWITRGVPVLCDAHVYNNRPVCFRASSEWWWGGLAGIWRLVTPLEIGSILPGTNPKLVGLSIKALIHLWNSIGHFIENKISIEIDGAEEWSSGIQYALDKWRVNEWSSITGFSIPLSGKTNFNVAILQEVMAVTGALELHTGYLRIDGTYESEVAPLRVTVEITVQDMMTSRPISNALVRLMSGAVIIATGYTNGAGSVSFPNMSEGSYAVKITASGYENLEESAKATYPAVAYSYFLAPLPKQWYQDWILPAAVGLGALGVAGVVISARRKSQPPIIVVR